MKRLRFPSNCSKALKGAFCLLIVVLLVFNSVSNTVLAAGVIGGTPVIGTSNPGGNEQNLGTSDSNSGGEQSGDLDGSIAAPDDEPVVDESNTDTTTSSEESNSQPEELGSEDTSAQNILYDVQPTTLEEVQEAIDTYETTYLERLESETPESALEVQKAHWEFEVAAELMPEGYVCQKVEDDEGFGSVYYTFFVNATTLAGNWYGNGTAGAPYQIATAEQLKKLSEAVAAGNKYKGVYFELTADINLIAYPDWTPIGGSPVQLVLGHVASNNGSPIYGSTGSHYATPFEGIFDGKGFTISNAVSTSGSVFNATADYKGVFGVINNATIKNTIISNATFTGGSGVGALVGYTFGNVVIENCAVKNSNISTSGTSNLSTGGMIGEVDYDVNHVVRILNCTAEDTNVSSTANFGTIGGLIGKIGSNSQGPASPIDNLNGDVLVSGCSASGGSVTSTYYYAGGLIGQILVGHTGGNTITISSCKADIPVKTTGGTGYYVGGLLGFLWLEQSSKNNSVLIEDCHAYGDVEGRGYYVGGLAGFLENYDDRNTTGNAIIVEGSSAHGTVRGSRYYNGGLVGHTHNGVVIRSCWATGDVYGSSYRNGGLVGYSYGYRGYDVKNGICIIENSYATGNIYGSSNEQGGLVGLADNTTIRNCFAIGSVQGAGAAGALAGGFYGSGSSGLSQSDVVIENCYATGTVNGGTSRGFVGNVYGTAKFTSRNNYFDTTTTKQTNAGTTGVTGLTTQQMIEAINYAASWAIKDNRNGKANGAGTFNNPWYIDEEITYPYLYYQYDGHTKAEVNYNLGSTKYSFVDGTVTGKHLGQRRADFTIPTNTVNRATYYSVKTTGANKVYFPFTFGDYPFNGVKEIRVPTTGSHAVASATTLYSLGGVSATDIVSFDPLPYAEKTSDRTPYQEGVESTYTMRGDLIEYSILISNPSIRYEWLGVKLTDALPEGLTLVEGLYNSANYEVKVKVTDTNGNVSEYVAPKDAPSGSDPYYYEYSKATSDGETDSDFVVYLGDMPVADEDTGAMPTIEVIFTAIPDRRAVSAFPLNDPANIIKNGDNIRNKGIVEGTIREVEDHTNTFEYDTDFDDENKDPVYDFYKVSYIGNGGQTAAGDIVYTEYYLYDESFTVHDNQGNPFKFTWLYHTYLDEWYSRPENIEGSTVVYDIGSTYGLVSNMNPIAPGFRESSDEIENIYEDYYAKTDFKLYAGWREDKGSITINKEGDTGEDGQPVRLENAYFLLERQVDDGAGGTTWEKIKWDSTTQTWIELPAGESYSGITDANGRLEFGKDNDDSTTGIADPSTLAFGTYRITEVQSPHGYTLLDKPLIAVIPFEKVLGKDEIDPNDGYVAKVEEGDNIRYLYFDITYTVQNVANFELPESGNEDILPHMIWITGAIIMAASVVCYLYYRKHTQLKA